jgi:glutamyl-tRNA synthetase
MSEQKVVTRFAPSPTGNLHSGAYRTAIFAYLYARKHNGKFIVRIEDTDKERSKDEYTENILESLNWLGLDFDEKYIQSENVTRHKQVLEKMVADGHAYISKEEAKDGSGVIKEIVRFKNPNIDVTFEDEIKGSVTMNTGDLGDFVIAKNINEPLFHLAVVVDDFDEGVTHVIRGEDHVSNTPRQILIQKAIGAPTPMYAHLPLVLGTDKQKLSKRKGALAVTDYRDKGYLPEALLNMVAMVGWNPGTEQELFSKQELVASFELSKVQKSPAVFNEEKLNWFNKEYIKKLGSEDFWKNADRFIPDWVKKDEMKTLTIEHLMRDRIEKFADVATFFEEHAFLFSKPEYKAEQLLWKGTATKENTKTHIAKVIELCEGVENWNKDAVHGAVFPYADQAGRGEVLWPMRVALSGKDKSPDPFTLAEILGKKETLERLEVAKSLL